jgi:hypothetical protein
MDMAHDLPMATLRSAPDVAEPLEQTPSLTIAAPAAQAVAWVVPWGQYRADALLADVLDDGYRVQVATEPTTVATDDGEVEVERGALVVHAGLQPERTDPVGARLAELAEEHGVNVHAATSGLALSGVDLGSPSVPVLEPVRPALLVGPGVNTYAAGAVWHWFDTRLAQPVTQIDTGELGRTRLGDYTHLIVPPGWYRGLGERVRRQMADFVKDGGTLVAFGDAAEMVQALDLDWSLVDEEGEDEDSQDAERRAYGDFRQDYARELIGGSALRVDLDLTHPMAWGYADRDLVLHRDGAHVLRPATNEYAQVAVYADDVLAAGYLSERNRERLAGTPAVSVTRHGGGRVVRIADQPLFRGYWRGGEKLFANALFFSQVVGSTRLPYED